MEDMREEQTTTEKKVGKEEAVEYMDMNGVKVVEDLHMKYAYCPKCVTAYVTDHNSPGQIQVLDCTLKFRVAKDAHFEVRIQELKNAEFTKVMETCKCPICQADGVEPVEATCFGIEGHNGLIRIERAKTKPTKTRAKAVKKDEPVVEKEPEKKEMAPVSGETLFKFSEQN